jgi:hypothetical protein
MILRGATSLQGALEGVGPENLDFFGPWNGTSEASAELGPPPPPPAKRMCLSPFGSGGGRTRLLERGLWGPNSD